MFKDWGRNKERKEEDENYVYKTKSQATKEKAKFFIKLAESNPYKEVPKEIMDKMIQVANEKQKKTNHDSEIYTSNEELRKDQTLEKLTQSIEQNNQKKMVSEKGRQEWQKM